MQRLHFYRLTRERQDRFVASTQSAAPPAPIVVRRGPGLRAPIYALLSAVSLLALGVLGALGFGSLSNSLAVQKPSLLVLYGVLAFLVPFGILRAVAAFKEAKKLPFKPGVYAFPMCLVDARKPALRVVPMTDLVNSESRPDAFVLRFKGASYSFPATDADAATRLRQELDIAQANVKHALAGQDESELVTLDPLYEAKRWTSPIGPKEALKEWSPSWRRFDILFALGAAIVFGPTLWFVRNASSDDSMFKHANALATPDSYRAYLSQAGNTSRHHDNVERVLLPRAELKDAKALGTVEAIQAFFVSHPASDIYAEAKAALHDAYAREFEKAKAQNTVGALRSFLKKYPASGMDTETNKAIHALYTGVFSRFRGQGASSEVLVFVQHLLAYLESHGPTVRVGMTRELSAGLDRADKLITDSPINKGLGTKQVTRHLENKSAPVTTDVIASSLESKFDDVFPRDVLLLVPLTNTDDATLAALKEPSVVLRYHVSWLGTWFTSATLKRAFVGLTIAGDATFAIPGDAAAFSVKFNENPGRLFLADYASPTHPLMKTPPLDANAPEDSVYATQELRGIDLATAAIEQAFFKPTKP